MHTPKPTTLLSVLFAAGGAFCCGCAGQPLGSIRSAEQLWNLPTVEPPPPFASSSIDTRPIAASRGQNHVHLVARQQIHLKKVPLSDTPNISQAPELTHNQGPQVIKVAAEIILDAPSTDGTLHVRRTSLPVISKPIESQATRTAAAWEDATSPQPPSWHF